MLVKADGTLKSPLKKLLSVTAQDELIQHTGCRPGDLLLVAASSVHTVVGRQHPAISSKGRKLASINFPDSAPMSCSAPCWATFACSVQSCWRLVAWCSGILLPSTSCGWWTSRSSCPKRRIRRSWSRLIIPSLPRCRRTHTCCTRSHTR